MSSPYSLSSTHLIRSYQEGISSRFNPGISPLFHCRVRTLFRTLDSPNCKGGFKKETPPLNSFVSQDHAYPVFFAYTCRSCSIQ